MDLEMFLKKNGINAKEFLDKYGQVGLTPYEDFDNRISRFAMYGDYEERMVDIADVVGIPRYLMEKNSIVENFANLFDPIGDLYHSRANGMLEYDSSNVVERLKRSFNSEPLRMYKIKDKYFISSNGSHRFHLLKMHYLMSMFKGEDVKGKYKIPVKVKKLDYVKTFVNYISSLLWDESFEINSEYDEKYNLTGKCVVTYKNQQMVMSDEELIDFLKDRIQSLISLDSSYYVDAVTTMWEKYQWEETGLFKTFIQEYFPEMVSVLSSSDYALLEKEIEDKLIGGVAYGNN